MVDISYHYAAASRVTFVGLDTSTQGNWKGVYGSDGYNVINDSSSYPAYATVTPSGNMSYTWNSAPSDTRALQRGGTGRIAACWYNGSSFNVALVQTDNKPHQLAFYCLDWDSATRVQTVNVLDSVTGAVLNSQTVTNFNGGQYVIWNILGNATINFTRTGTANAVLSGIFFAPAPFQPADADGDSIPDVMEDINGNGVFDPGEKDWETYNSPNGLTAADGLQVFTPLK